MSTFILAISCLTISNLPWFMDLTFHIPAILFFTVSEFTSQTSHIHNWVLFWLWLHSFWSYFFTVLQQHIGLLLTCGIHLSVSYLFAFSYYSWGSQGQNTEVVCHSLLQWTMFCQNSPPWLICLGWLLHSMAHGFFDLDKAVVHVISLIRKHFLQRWAQ